MAGHLVEQQRGDEEPAEDEEEVDAEVAALDHVVDPTDPRDLVGHEELEVGDDDQQDGEAADAVEGRAGR